MITLPPMLDRLVKNQVKSGLYASETEVVCEALRRTFSQEATLERLRDQAAEGFAQLDQGDFDDLNRQDILDLLNQRRTA